jgi:hypothetical protein
MMNFWMLAETSAKGCGNKMGNILERWRSDGDERKSGIGPQSSENYWRGRCSVDSTVQIV